MFVVYEKLLFFEIYFIYGNGISFYKINRLGIYVIFDKYIFNIYIRELWNINCIYFINFIYVVGYGVLF